MYQVYTKQFSRKVELCWANMLDGEGDYTIHVDMIKGPLETKRCVCGQRIKKLFKSYQI